MIEMRVVLHKNRINPEIQYRHYIFTTDASGGLCPFGEWSEWKTAEWVTAETLDELAQ